MHCHPKTANKATDLASLPTLTGKWQKAKQTAAHRLATLESRHTKNCKQMRKP
jgi:hypothetical protein